MLKSILTGSETSEINAILDSRTASNAAILQQDVAGVAKYWMNDMVVISGEGTPYVGKALLIEIWEDMFAVDQPPVFERNPVEITIGASGILAWETGTWKYHTASFKGNYSAMWRKIKGKWMTQSELFVSLD
ncbi:YybH family protein [Pedobacter sp. AW31-3R]|uniref:YybH family protein n=1 Tax=Pedobacter sp. AW31-3R TaxID=3445781 RepID=UPI003FA06B81